MLFVLTQKHTYNIQNISLAISNAAPIQQYNLNVVCKLFK